MKWNKIGLVAVFIFVVSLIGFSSIASALDQKVFDEAGLLSESEAAELEALADELSKKWNTDFIIITTNDTGGRTAEKYMADFYDEKIEQQGLKKWNAAVLSIDMGRRDLYLGAFYKAKLFMDNARIDQMLDVIAPKMSAGRYFDAFKDYFVLADQYMSGEPANIFLQWWLQILIAAGLGIIVVGTLIYNSGGRVTVNSSTYIDQANSNVIASKDQYIRTTVTKTKKPSNNSGGGFGGGGGRTGGGHSYSGGGRRF